MKPELVADYPLWLCEMFYEQQARHLDKPTVAAPSRWDVADVAALLEGGVSFAEAKSTLVFVWRADTSNYWADRLSTAQDWVTAFDTLHERVCKTMPPGRANATAATSAAHRVGADHIRSQEDTTSIDGFYEASGEERPSDDAREMYQPPQLESVPTGPDVARKALKELGES